MRSSDGFLLPLQIDNLYPEISGTIYDEFIFDRQAILFTQDNYRIYNITNPINRVKTQLWIVVLAVTLH